MYNRENYEIVDDYIILIKSLVLLLAHHAIALIIESCGENSIGNIL